MNLLSRNNEGYPDRLFSLLVDEANNSRNLLGACTLSIICNTRDSHQLLILVIVHVTSLLFTNSSAQNVSANSARIEVPDQHVGLLIPVVTLCRVIMRCVPNLTEVVISSSPLTEISLVESELIVRTRSNVTLSHPSRSVQRTCGISIVSNLSRIDIRHELVVAIYIKLIVTFELLLGEAFLTELSENQVLNL